MARSDSELVLATPTALTPLVSLAGVVDRVHPTDGLDKPLHWTGPRPALAVNLHGRGPESTRLLTALAPDRLVAFRCPEADLAGPVWRRDEHEVTRWCRLLQEALGVRADPSDLVLARPEVPSPAGERAVVIHPGAAFASRRWPPERFAAVAVHARACGLPVVVTGSAAERELAGSVAAQAGLAPAAVLAGRTSLVELAALVAGARLVITGDTGVAHLATAYRTPSVVLFGPVSPHLWGPPVAGPHRTLWHEGAPGDPWGGSVDPALLDITVAEVVAAAEELLGQPSGW